MSGLALIFIAFTVLLVIIGIGLSFLWLVAVTIYFVVVFREMVEQGFNAF